MPRWRGLRELASQQEGTTASSGRGDGLGPADSALNALSQRAWSHCTNWTESIIGLWTKPGQPPKNTHHKTCFLASFMVPLSAQGLQGRESTVISIGSGEECSDSTAAEGGFNQELHFSPENRDSTTTDSVRNTCDCPELSHKISLRDPCKLSGRHLGRHRADDQQRKEKREQDGEPLAPEAFGPNFWVWGCF